MGYLVCLGEGLDQLKFGERRDSVRTRFGECRTFNRAGGPLATDHFVEAGLMVTYGPGDEVVEIEVVRPASVTLGVHQLLGLSIEEGFRAFESEGLIPATDNEEFVDAFPSGIGLFCVDRVVDCVSISAPRFD